jgi:hypothetical protein
VIEIRKTLLSVDSFPLSDAAAICANRPAGLFDRDVHALHIAPAATCVATLREHGRNDTPVTLGVAFTRKTGCRLLDLLG